MSDAKQLDIHVVETDGAIQKLKKSVFPSEIWKRMIDDGTTRRINECLAFVPPYKTIFQFCKTAQCYYVYEDGIWEQEGKKDSTHLYTAYGELVKMIDIYTYDLESELHNLKRERKRKEEANKLEKHIESCYHLMKNLCEAPFLNKCFMFQYVEFLTKDLTSQIDSKKNLFAFSDCVWDLDAGIELHHHPGRLIMTNTGYPFPRERNEEVEAKLWDTFNSMFHDPADALYMLKTIAYCLHGDKSTLSLFFVWVGSGGNGKGIIYQLIKRAFGGYFSPLTSAYLTQKRSSSSGPQPELANKKGKRVVISTEPETEEGDHFRMDKIKELSDDIEVRGLYQSPFTFSPQFGLIIQSNQDPVFTSDKKRPNNAILRRYRGLHFPIKFVPDPDSNNKNERRSDPALKRLCEESDDYRDSFIRILFDVYEEHVKGRSDIEAPPNVKTYVANVVEDHDEYGQFLRDCVERTTNKEDKVLRGDLIRAFYDYTGKYVDPSPFTKTMRKDYGLQTNQRNWTHIKLLKSQEE